MPNLGYADVLIVWLDEKMRNYSRARYSDEAKKARSALGSVTGGFANRVRAVNAFLEKHQPDLWWLLRLPDYDDNWPPPGSLDEEARKELWGESEWIEIYRELKELLKKSRAESKAKRKRRLEEYDLLQREHSYQLGYNAASQAHRAAGANNDVGGPAGNDSSIASEANSTSTAGNSNEAQLRSRICQLRTFVQEHCPTLPAERINQFDVLCGKFWMHLPGSSYSASLGTSEDGAIDVPPSMEHEHSIPVPQSPSSGDYIEVVAQPLSYFNWDAFGSIGSTAEAPPPSHGDAVGAVYCSCGSTAEALSPSHGDAVGAVYRSLGSTAEAPPPSHGDAVGAVYRSCGSTAEAPPSARQVIRAKLSAHDYCLLQRTRRWLWNVDEL